MSEQHVKIFFRGTPPANEAIKSYLDRSPLSEIIVSEANRGPFEILRRNAFMALKQMHHSPRGQSFLVDGRSGMGKTYIMGQYAKTLEIPYILIQSEGLKSTWMLFERIVAEFQKTITPIVPEDREDNYAIPPCIVAFDEAQALPKNLMKGGLLNAMEHSDGILQTTPNKKSTPITVNCKHVCWAAMTTDKGLLFDAFKNRLENSISWAAADAEDIRRILMLQLTKEFNKHEVPILITDEAARIVAQYELVPRSALSFARQMIYQIYMSQCGWQAAAKTVASNLRKVFCGLNEKQIKVLSALGQRPISKNALTVVAQCRRIEELEKDILPDLMEYSNNGPFVVSLSGRGCVITRAGVQILNNMGIANKGDRVTAETMESRRAG
jgi:hypothetical protein